MDDVGLNIKARRNEIGFTQAELARRSGISQSAISDIESRRVTKKPSTDTVQRIASALGCTVAELMGESDRTASDVPGQLSSDEMQLLSDYRSLNRSGREFVRQFMDSVVAMPKYKKHDPVSNVENAMTGSR